MSARANAQPGAEPTGHNDRTGTLLESRYELVRLIGAGGMGEVYEARHRELGRRVAVKFLLPKYAANPELVTRFENEARAAGLLDHENIVAVTDIGVAPDGARYLVMELLHGEDGSQLLARCGALAPERATVLVQQVCRGLSAAHESGIVHRDLKPANLFVTRRADGSDLVKLLDFGIAKLLPDAGAQDAQVTGPALGTPQYMSPEQARGDSIVDARTDVFALGAILYEFLSGQRAFVAESTLQLLHRIATRAPTPLAQLRPELSGQLCNIVEKALAKDPERRFASAPEFEEALAALTWEGAAARPSIAAAPLDVTRPTADTSIALRVEGGPTTTHAPVAPRATARQRSAVRRIAGIPVWPVLAGSALLAALGWAAERRSNAPRGPADLPASAPSAHRVSAEAPAKTPVEPTSEHSETRPDTELKALPGAAHSRGAAPAQRSAAPTATPAPARGTPTSSVGAAVSTLEMPRLQQPASAPAPVELPPSSTPSPEPTSTRKLRIDRDNPYP